MRGSIHNEADLDSYKVEVKQLIGYEKVLKFQTNNIEGKVKMYINYNAPATRDNYIWSTSGNYITVIPEDGNYHTEGTYFVMLEPQYQLWDLFIDNYYTYTLTFSTSDSYLYLQSSLPFENKQSANSLDYFRHYITQSNKDISLALTVFSGTPIVYTSFDPDIKKPNKTHHDMNSSQISSGGSRSKAFYFAAQKIQKSSPSCRSYALTEQEPCALYVAVQCVDECKYSLKLTYDTLAPQQLILGVP